jgi:hypothetical protein
MARKRFLGRSTKKTTRKPMAVSQIKLRKVQSKYLSNEDQNLHSENAVLLAETFGNPAEVARMKEILKIHRKSGEGISRADQLERDRLSSKYYPKLSANFTWSPLLNPVNDQLVTEVFNNPSHPLTPMLKERFGVDQGTGVKVLSGSKADYRRMLNTLESERTR